MVGMASAAVERYIAEVAHRQRQAGPPSPPDCVLLQEIDDEPPDAPPLLQVRYKDAWLRWARVDALRRPGHVYVAHATLPELWPDIASQIVGAETMFRVALATAGADDFCFSQGQWILPAFPKSSWPRHAS